MAKHFKSNLWFKVFVSGLLISYGAAPARAGETKTKSVSYALDKKSVKEMCDALQEDYADSAFRLVAETALSRQPECDGCISFLKSVVSPCRKKAVLKKKVSVVSADAPATSVGPPVIKQHPRAYTVDRVSSTFAKFGEDETTLAERAELVSMFASMLERAEGLKAREREYLSTIAAYVRAPFEEALQTKMRAKKKAKPKASREAIDDLFE